MVLHRRAESRAYGVRRDVVMGWTNAAGRENIGVAGPEGVDRGHDFGLDVGNEAGFGKVDPERDKEAGNCRQIRVLRAARQDFVPDDEHGSGIGRCAGHHDVLISAALTASVPIPKFALSRYRLLTNFGIERTLASYWFQCRFGFEVRRERDIGSGANFETTTLAP